MFSTVKSLWTVTGGIARMGLDACFPPHCAACDVQVGAQGNLCGACFAQLRQIARPYCECCGMPFPHAMDTGVCAACAAGAPVYAKARAAWVYNDTSGALVRRLKFQDRSSMLVRYAEAMMRAGQDVLEGADIVVPVPLHWRRLMWRRYNQSALLAFALGRKVGLPVDATHLRRIRHTVPQTQLRGEQRRRNVRGAFVVRDAAWVQQKRVVLVDDVLTTGATVEACVQALLAAGAVEVRVLTLARTLRE